MAARPLPLLGLLLLAACNGEEEKQAPIRPDPGPIVRNDGEPDRVTYHQILVSFRGAKGDLNTTRTKAEASLLAHTLKQRILAGEKFVELMNQYSDDRAPGAAVANGPYVACNLGIPHRLRPDQIPELPRGNIERAVGDTLFRMNLHEAKLLEYDADYCPWGWHLLWRVE